MIFSGGGGGGGGGGGACNTRVQKLNITCYFLHQLSLVA